MADKPKQYLFVSNRDIVLGSIHGHSIEFLKGVPTHLPRICHKEAIEKGILPVEQEDLAAVTAEKPAQGLAPDGAMEREDEIVAAMKIVVGRNKAAEFDGPTPGVKAISAITGWPAERGEVRKIWEARRGEIKNKG